MYVKIEDDERISVIQPDEEDGFVFIEDSEYSEASRGLSYDEVMFYNPKRGLYKAKIDIGSVAMVAILKRKLLDTDYQAIKFAEGELSEEQYAPIREQRRQWRIRINELENGNC